MAYAVVNYPIGPDGLAGFLPSPAALTADVVLPLLALVAVYVSSTAKAAQLHVTMTATEKKKRPRPEQMAEAMGARSRFTEDVGTCKD